MHKLRDAYNAYLHTCVHVHRHTDTYVPIQELPDSSSRGGNYFIEDTVVPLTPLKPQLKTQLFHWFHHFINWFHRSVDGQYCIMDHPHQYWLVKISSDGQYYIMDHPHQYWLVKISSDGQYYIVDHPHQYWQVKISSDGQYYIMDHPHQYWLVKISSDGQYYIVDHPHQMFQSRNCPTVVPREGTTL